MSFIRLVPGTKFSYQIVSIQSRLVVERELSHRLNLAMFAIRAAKKSLVQAQCNARVHDLNVKG